MIQISNAKKSFGDLCVFENLNLNIQNPGLFVLKGESGSGKSTLLNLLAGYDKFDEGTIDIDENIATIFQNYELIQEITVLDNILLTKDKLSENEKDILNTLELNDLLYHYPNELSGGQKQRVGIARALALNPNIILCDEPTESLDIDNKHIVMDLLNKLSKEKIVIVATHDELMIERYADKIFSINNQNIDTQEIRQMNNFMRKIDKYKIDDNQLKKLIHKILNKSSRKASWIIIALVMVIQQLFLYNQKMFYIPKTTNTVNANVLYIEAYRNEFNPTYLGLTQEEIQPIIPFYSVNINNTYESFEIYPYEENALKIEGKKPEKNEVVINKNLAEYLGEWKGKTITGEYSFSTIKDKIEFEIVGVIDEIDSNRFSIYYNLEGVLEDFDQGLISVVNKNKEEILTYTEYLKSYGTAYKVIIPNDEMSEYYARAERRYDFSVKNPLYDQRNEIREDSIIFQIMFYSFEIILMIGLILYIILYINKDTNRYLSVCAILISSQIPIKQIIKCYFIEKTKPIMLHLMVCESIFLGFNLLTGYLKVLELQDLIILASVILVLLLIYVFELTLSIRKLKVENISNILKEDN